MRKLLLPAILCATLPAMGLEIELDFTHDEEAEQFFSSNSEARSAVEKAAEDLGFLLTNSMTQVSKDVFEGINGSAKASFDWSWSYTNPVTGDTVIIDEPSIAADTITIYAGTRNLSGTTLGQGGAGGAGLTLSATGFSNGWSGAVDLAEAESNSIMSRGSGPIINSFSGSADFGGNIGQYELHYGLSIGNLWFDADWDNNGVRDSDTQLANNWHYGINDLVPNTKTDLYSVALHEILHVLGAGTSSTWNDLADGRNWLGAEAAAIAGTSNILSSDGAHLRSGIMSVRLSDGVLQEAALSPSITPGSRKEITELDLAILADLGYQITSPVPEPSALSLIGMAGIIAMLRRNRR